MCGSIAKANLLGSSLTPIRYAFRAPYLYGRRRPGIFFDRDGVINERILGGYVTHWTGFHFIDGMVPVLRRLSRLHLPIIVVSNQSGVGKGLLSQRSLRQITSRFVDLLARHGARIDAVYYCPHTDEQGCTCRKPKPGLLLRAAGDYRIDLGRSIMIGDEPRDMEAAAAAGCRGILLDHGTRDLPFNRDRATKASAPEWVVAGQVADLPAQVGAMLGRFVL
ncbi:MAG TPA: HAD family hydrolase [Terriglobia bacterium]|nr:HAD family hydrolase [Terriglobia bacterium]